MRPHLDDLQPAERAEVLDELADAHREVAAGRRTRGCNQSAVWSVVPVAPRGRDREPRGVQMLVAEPARAAVYHAIAMARRCNAAVVDTGHLLAGVAAARDTVMRAVWRELGVDPAMLQALATAGSPDPGARRSPGRRRPAVLAGHAPAHRPAAFSANARRVLSDAFVLARAHGARRLRPGHLVLAIVAQREDDPGRGLLSALGVDPSALVQTVCARMAGDARGGPPTVTPEAGVSDPWRERPVRDR